MAGTTATRGRQSGRIETLPSGSLRPIVYAGVDPVTKKRHYLREVVPAGPKAQKDAERALRRLVSQVDDQESARTSATVDQLLDQHFELLDSTTWEKDTKFCVSTNQLWALVNERFTLDPRVAYADTQLVYDYRRGAQHMDRLHGWDDLRS